jgi:hypothetical protein
VSFGAGVTGTGFLLEAPGQETVLVRLSYDGGTAHDDQQAELFLTAFRKDDLPRLVPGRRFRWVASDERFQIILI